MMARSQTGTPHWVKVFAGIAVVFLLAIVVLHLRGHGFGPHMHAKHQP